MLKIARTQFEVPRGASILCGLTQPFGPGVEYPLALEVLAEDIWRNAGGYCEEWSLAEELARTALRDFHFPYTVRSEVTVFLYWLEA